MKARIMITAFALASATLGILAMIPLSRAWN